MNTDGERLQKVLARLGFGSRRVCEELIADGRVTVNGSAAELGRRVDVEADVVAVDGSVVGIRPGLVYYLLNKPVGVVTTASDVYSIGVLVYLLVAGRPPYDLAGLSPPDAMRTICEVEPPPPSSVASADARSLLRGDLDRVVLKALRKDPRERYHSVFDLSHDLTAWLHGHVVSATPATSPQASSTRSRR